MSTSHYITSLNFTQRKGAPKHQLPPSLVIARAMADRNAEDAIPPTDTTRKDAGLHSDESSRKETIAHLQSELLNAADEAPDKVFDLVSRLRNIGDDVDISPRDPDGNTPLHVLLRDFTISDAASLKLLSMMSKDEINVAGRFGRTPLIDALTFQRSEVSAALVAAGADISFQSRHRRAPVRLACRYAPLKIARLIIEQAIKHNIDLNIHDGDGDTPLHDACSRRGKVGTDILQILLDSKVGLDKHVVYLHPPIFCAVRAGNIESVKAMIRHGFDIHVKSPDGTNALFVASSSGKPEMVKFLIEIGVDCNDVSSRDVPNSLIVASTNGYGDIVRLLVQGGADMNAQSYQGCTPLCSAAKRDQSDVVQILLDLKADINGVDSEGKTPLATACLEGRVRMTKQLLQNQADPLISDIRGRSPLWMASCMGYAEIVDLLLPIFPTLANIADDKGLTALHAACSWVEPPSKSSSNNKASTQYGRTIDYLLKDGADVALRTNAGETALHLAAGSPRGDNVHAILSRMNNQDVSATTIDGKTALDYAVDGRNRDSACILLARCSFGVDINPAVVHWAAEDEKTHQIVKTYIMKLVKGQVGYGGRYPVPDWGVLALTAYIGWFALVPRILQSLYTSPRRIEHIRQAIEVVDAGREYRNAEALTTAANLRDSLGEVSEPVQSAAALDHTAVMALLKAAESSARTSKFAGELQLSNTGVDVEFEQDATIHDFYSTGDESTVSRSSAPVPRVVYGDGPESIMEQQRRENEITRSDLAEMFWPDDEGSRALKTEVLQKLTPHQKEDFRVRWIHLPANNVRFPVSMNGMMRLTLCQMRWMQVRTVVPCTLLSLDWITLLILPL